jgi:hypothetical protein
MGREGVGKINPIGTRVESKKKDKSLSNLSWDIFKKLYYTLSHAT